MIPLNLLLLIGIIHTNKPILSKALNNASGESLLSLFELSLPSNECELLLLQRLNGIYLLFDSLNRNTIIKTNLIKYNLNGELNWKTPIGNEFWKDALTIGDMDSDKIDDIIALSGIYNSVYDSIESAFIIINNKTGKVVTYSSPVSHSWCLLSDKIFDVNNDKQMDIAYLNLSMEIKLLTISTGKILWNKQLLSPKEYDEIVLFDVIPSPTQPIIYNYDKKNKIFLTFEPYIWCLNAHTGSIDWFYKEEIIKFIGSPIILDCSNNGILEIILGAILSEELFGYKKIAIYAYNILSGAPIWKTYLDEYNGNVKPIIQNFNFGDIPVLLIAIEGSDEIFLLEGKKGVIIGRQKLPFLIKSVSVVETDDDSLPEVIFLGTEHRPFKHETSILVSLFIYDIDSHPLSYKLFAKGSEYELLPSYFFQVFGPNIPGLYQEYKSSIPFLFPKVYYTSDDECKFQFADDIDNDGFVEVVMISPPGYKEQKLRVLRIIPTSKK